MKKLVSILFAIIFSFIFFISASAQTAESMWITASTSNFKTGETVILTFNAISATPIQGFTFQIRYDPACLEPVNAASPISGMNGLLLPQLGGLADVSFASTTPVTANGLLAEVRFTTLGACQTNLTLESAALAVKSETGIAVPLSNITIPDTQKAIPLTISSEQGTASDQPLVGAPLSLEVETEATSNSSLSFGTIAMLVIIGVLLITGLFILIRILKSSDKK